MIPLIPFLALAPQRGIVFDSSPWVKLALRDAPPSPPSISEVPLIRHPGGGVELPPNTVILLHGSGVATSPNDPPDPVTQMNRRTDALIERGEYEKAYRLQEEGGSDLELSGDDLHDLHVETALLTGRYSEARALLVPWFRVHPGTDGIFEAQFSLALAAQGQVYPGQGASVLAYLRHELAYDRDLYLAARYRAPTAPADVAALSVLALGLKGDHLPFMEWALRLDPGCALAASQLVDLYWWRHRDADAARVAASMVKRLPPGPLRDRFARRLRGIQQRMSAGDKPATPSSRGASNVPR